MIESDSMFRTRADARYRSVGGEGIVVRQTAGEVLVLNEVGVRVLDLLASGKRVGQVVDTLAGEYDVDSATLERDVPVYIRELLEAEIIERSTA